MVLQSLPYIHFHADLRTPPVYTDHHLFTATIHKQYEYPEHTSGLGILSTLSGNGHYFINGRKFSVDAQSFAIINYGSKLAVQMPKPETQPAFLFFDTRLCAGLPYLEGLHIKTRSLHDTLQLLPRLGDTCSSFHSLKADSIIRSVLEQMIVQNRSAAKYAAGLQVVKTTTRIELFRRLALSKQWMEANYHLPITLQQMAEIAALNSQHFLRMFSQCYGATPHQHLINVRLECSKKLLKETNEPVATICASTGFESASSFSGLFKKRFGISPSAFRK